MQMDYDSREIARLMQENIDKKDDEHLVPL
jgi:hypothetical protein